MNVVTLMIFVIVAIILSIAANYKLKINLGIVAMAFAYIIGCFFLNLKVSEVVLMWPTRVVFQLMTLTLFFSFATQNGTLKVVADKMLYSCRKAPWILPIAIYLVAALLSAFGGPPPVANTIMTVIAFSLAVESGLNPLIVAVAVCYGANAGSFLPWAAQGAVVKGVVEEYYAGLGTFYTWKIFFNFLIFCFILLLIMCFLFKGFKSKAISMEKPAGFNPIQKKNFIIILIAIALVIVPPLLTLFIKSPALKSFARALDIQMVAIIGSIFCILMKLGDEKVAVTRGIPWNTIIMLGGISMLISVASAGGVPEYIAGALSSNVSPALITMFLAILGGILSFFSGGINAVFPMLMVIAVPVAEATGMNPAGIMAAMATAVSMTAISPFSTGGALIIANCPEQKYHQTLFSGQLILAFATLALCAVVAFTGLFSII